MFREKEKKGEPVYLTMEEYERLRRGNEIADLSSIADEEPLYAKMMRFYGERCFVQISTFKWTKM